ncbi:MAG: endolytic transglycosylase MltG, partial [Gemmatimonadales bacterium]|nr:endolytic transglycosylase MltG [Gemmatimonadales bacterium]
MSNRKTAGAPLQRHDIGTRPRSPAEALEPGRAPARPRGVRQRSESRAISGFVRLLSGLFTLMLIVMVAVGGASLMLYFMFERPGPLEVSRTVVIPKGEGRIEIAERLEREGVISNRWAFVASHLLQGWLGTARKNVELKAGEYEIKKGASMRQVLDTLSEGKSVLYKVTIPEGLTSQQIVERLKGEETLSGDITTIPAEGSLLPDTYRYSKGMSRQELL